MDILKIIFITIMFMLILIYIKNQYLNESFVNQMNKEPLQLTKRNINLGTNKSIQKECKNDFCYYDLNKIIERHNLNSPYGTFEAKNNVGHTLIITGGDVPLLINKALQIDIAMVKDKIHYRLVSLK